MLTSDNIQCTEGDVIEAVEWTLPCLLLQLFHQNFCLLVHHFQEVRQDGKVEGWRQHFPPLAPLSPSANQIVKDRKDTYFHNMKMVCVHG